MARLTSKIDVPLPPDEVWKHASDLDAFDSWLSVHEAWRGELPAELSAGTELSSVVRVKSFRNRVTWKIQEYTPPRNLKLKGDGKGGVKLGLVVDVKEKGDGSELAFTIELGGAPLFGPIGRTVAKALEGDIDASLARFVEIYG
ncbi:SRPBCC family protein [Rhodococcus rhodnii]|uniref:Toxin n=2 Tax=Rhodococcus rhodnii TaxID=38312 RepID=R7WR12_9NOCA|nr:SRPBCC family protein [Rhodococcus rhodnii]EOM77747.1 hypothetical protein Rrhod_0899 [Rhodococcus rhodnii LMG 5362]TXG92270.1 SRPBCC family protein [Rhodococcus rhodnii]